MPQAVATNNAGNWMQTLNTGLSSALDTWMKVEQVRQIKSSQGQDQLTKQFTPELENGAAVAVDPVSQANATAGGRTVPADGIVINKKLLMGSAALLVVAVLLKARGYK